MYRISKTNGSAGPIIKKQHPAAGRIDTAHFNATYGKVSTSFIISYCIEAT